MSKPIDQELLPCPFCGGPAHYIPADYVDAHGEPWPFAECDACNTGAPVEFWNRRASVQAAGGAVPEGYVLVPVEPTVAMRMPWKTMRGYCWHAKYKAMLAAAPHPVSGEQKPVTEFDQDISKVALEWMQLLGNFGPTVHADKRELKGYTMDSDGDTVKTYYDSGELRELAQSCIEVADWLDRRAQQGEQS